MNTKTAKYKKYLRLQKEQSDIEERYSFIIESSLGKRESRFNRYRGYSIGRNGAVDYTSIKEVTKVSCSKQYIQYSHHYKKYHYPQDKDLIELDLFKCAISDNFNKGTLLDCEITKEYYNKLSAHLQDYFYKRLDIWASLGTNKNIFKYLFKYDIKLKPTSKNVVIERYHIFSDITKAYNEIDDEISRLCNHNYKLWYNNTRKSYRDNHRRKARRILKQNLNNCIKIDNFDLIRDKYYGPECDKWDYD